MKLKRLISGIQGRFIQLFTIRRRLMDLEMRLLTLEESFDHLLESPRYLSSNNVGFNGQQGRKKIFAELVDAVQFNALVETGTFFGDTAAFIYEATKLPVFTCESNKHFYLTAKQRLAEFAHVTIEHNDSRQFLRSLAKSSLARGIVFFYLDAHWYRDVPLRGEIQLISENWREFVIMVDDFKVPGDDGYMYEPYGAGQYFVLDTIVDQLKVHGLKAYFPSLHSSQETGWRAGCVIITRVGLLTERLSRLSSLREATL